MAEVLASLPYDAEVQYIEKSGAAYIDTGIKAKSTITFDLTFYQPTHTTQGTIFGARAGSSSGLLLLMNDCRSTQKVSRWSYNTSATTKDSLPAGWYNINNRVNGANSAYIGNLAYTPSAATWSSDNNIYIGAYNDNGTATASDEATKFLPCKIWDNGVLVRDYICVRKNGFGYLYDRVTKQLFGNANSSGSFTCGADVPYTCEIDYIQTDGNAYINTGIYASNAVSVDITMYLTSGDTTWPFGGRNANNDRQLGIQNNSTYGLWWRWGENSAVGTHLDAGKYRFRSVANNLYVIGGGYTLTATANTFTSDYTVYLGALNNGGSASSKRSGDKIYQSYLYTDAVASRAYVPVRVGSVGYLYDRITNTLYGNAASSGAFGLGTDIK
jgi:flagellin-like hook-associated protein FlgL